LLFHGGTKENIIPSETVLEGTVRTFDEKVKERIKERIFHVCQGNSTSFETKNNVDYQDIYPATINTSSPHVAIIREISEGVVGKSNVIDPTPTMGSEDFSYFLQHKPGCFFFVGANILPASRKDYLQHHSQEFDIDERSLFVGASIWVNLIRHLLGKKKSLL